MVVWPGLPSCARSLARVCLVSSVSCGHPRGLLSSSSWRSSSKRTESLSVCHTTCRFEKCEEAMSSHSFMLPRSISSITSSEYLSHSDLGLAARWRGSNRGGERKYLGCASDQLLRVAHDAVSTPTLSGYHRRQWFSGSTCIERKIRVDSSARSGGCHKSFLILLLL